MHSDFESFSLLEPQRPMLVTWGGPKPWAAAVAFRMHPNVLIHDAVDISAVARSLASNARTCFLLADDAGPPAELVRWTRLASQRSQTLMLIARRHPGGELAWLLRESGAHGTIEDWDHLMKWIPVIYAFLRDKTVVA